jgi:hypothetical protein
LARKFKSGLLRDGCRNAEDFAFVHWRHAGAEWRQGISHWATIHQERVSGSNWGRLDLFLHC